MAAASWRPPTPGPAPRHHPGRPRERTHRQDEDSEPKHSGQRHTARGRGGHAQDTAHARECRVSSDLGGRTRTRRRGVRCGHRRHCCRMAHGHGGGHGTAAAACGRWSAVHQEHPQQQRAHRSPPGPPRPACLAVHYSMYPSVPTPTNFWDRLETTIPPPRNEAEWGSNSSTVSQLSIHVPGQLERQMSVTAGGSGTPPSWPRASPLPLSGPQCLT
jgi:hypothetical protein